jgi:ABC-type branched-subunit amino acid transport system permease subunit
VSFGHAAYLGIGGYAVGILRASQFRCFSRNRSIAS